MRENPEQIPAPPRPVSWRAVFVALGGMVPACYATASLPQSSIFSLLAAPVGVLLALIVLKATLGRFVRLFDMESTELTLVFGVIALASSVAAEWSALVSPQPHLLPFLADGNPAVRDRILPNLPDWLVIKDLAAVRDISVSGVEADQVWDKLPLFAPRYFGWGVLVLSVTIAFVLVASLMRGLWCEREKLRYPILHFPLAICQFGPGSIWRSRAFWIGFAVMFLVDLTNGFNYLYPAIPKIPIKQIFDTEPFLQDMPWRSMGEFKLGIYPFLAVLAFFIPNDLLGSLIGFFLARKAIQIVLGLNGIPQGTFAGTHMSPGPPYLDEQVWGGILALFVSAMWFGRHHLRDVWRQVMQGGHEPDEGLTHRAAFVGLILCLIVFCSALSFGLVPVWLSCLVFALVLVFGVVLMRIRAQLGPPTHEFAFMGPTALIGRFLGTQWMSESVSVWLNHVLMFVNRLSRTHPAPFALEAFKLAKLGNWRQRPVFWFLASACVAGFFLACWFYLVKDFRLGAPVRSVDGVGLAQAALSQKRDPDLVGIGMTGFGFGFVAILDFLRVRFPGFSVHPIGYVLGMSYGIDYYWFGLTLMLGVKVFVQRYFGMSGYERVRNAALGLMLAEYGAEAIWMAMALITKQSTYTIGFEDRSLGIQ